MAGSSASFKKSLKHHIFRSGGPEYHISDVAKILNDRLIFVICAISRVDALNGASALLCPLEAAQHSHRAGF